MNGMGGSAAFFYTVAASLALLLASGALFALSWIAARRRTRAREQLLGRIATAVDEGGFALQGIGGFLGRLGARRLQNRTGAELDAEVPLLLARAGLRQREFLAVYYGAQALLPLAGMGLVALSWLVTPGAGFSMRLFMALFVAFAVGYLAPKYVLRALARARQKKITEQVPVFVHLLRILFDAGLSLDQSLLVIATENRDVLPELSEELRLVIRQIGSGADRADALGELARTMDVPALNDMVALMRQIDRYGGAIQEPLSNFSRLLEERRRAELQEVVSKLSAKMTIVMVLFLFPALLAFLGGPGLIAIMQALTGMGE